MDQTGPHALPAPLDRHCDVGDSRGQRHQRLHTEYGKNLGQGLFEFRLRHGADDIVAMFTTKTPDERDKEPILLRVYCHAYGDKIVLLLAGYDKQADASKKRENQEIKLARKRLTEFKQQRRLKRLRRSRTGRKAGR